MHPIDSLVKHLDTILPTIGTTLARQSKLFPEFYRTFPTSLFQRTLAPRILSVNATHQHFLPLLQPPCHPTHSPMGTTTPIRREQIRKELQLRVSHDALR